MIKNALIPLAFANSQNNSDFQCLSGDGQITPHECMAN